MADENREPQHPYPIGTLEELREMGFLDPAEYHTCAQPNKDAGVLGCKFWKECQLRGGDAFGFDFGDEAVRGKSGPQNFGVQLLWRKSTGRRIVNSVRACYELPLMSLKADNSQLGKYKRTLKIIAREGELIHVNTMGPIDEDVPGQGKRRTWHPVKGGHPTEVPKYPRPNNNPVLAVDSFSAAETERIKQRKRDRNEAEFVGRVDSQTVKPKEGAGGPDKRTQGPRG